MKMLILTFKDHSIKRKKKTNPLYSVTQWGAVGRQNYKPGTRSVHTLAEPWPYSFKCVLRLPYL